MASWNGKERRLRAMRPDPHARMPETLPASVVFGEIDYNGEHMNLAVPVVATVTLDNGDVFIFNDEARVRGSGPTL